MLRTSGEREVRGRVGGHGEEEGAVFVFEHLRHVAASELQPIRQLRGAVAKVSRHLGPERRVFL